MDNFRTRGLEAFILMKIVGITDRRLLGKWISHSSILKQRENQR